MEVTIPLLEEYKLEPEIPQPEVSHSKENVGKKKGKAGKDGKGGKKKSNKSSKASGKKGKKSNKSSKASGKKGKKLDDSPYSAPDEFEDEIKSRIKNHSFKTDRLPWSKIIQFPEQALKINVPNNIEKKLTVMRDVFRTSVNVKAIFTQVLPPPKPGKKGKKDKKGKGKKDKKGKDKKGQGKDKKKDRKKGGKSATTSETKSSVATEPEKEPEPEPTETVLKKITLANFDCELHHPNWSIKTDDYYWCKHEKFPSKSAVKVEGSLRKILYTEAKKKKKDKKGVKEKGAKGKKDKGKKSTKKLDEVSKKNKKNEEGKKGKAGKKDKESSKSKKSKALENQVEEEEFIIMREAPLNDVLPDIFTVQVGFGLNRTPPIKEISQESDKA